MPDLTTYLHRGILVREIRRDQRYPIWGHDYAAGPTPRAGMVHKGNSAHQIETAIDHWLDRSCRAHGAACAPYAGVAR